MDWCLQTTVASGFIFFSLAWSPASVSSVVFDILDRINDKNETNHKYVITLLTLDDNN